MSLARKITCDAAPKRERPRTPPQKVDDASMTGATPPKAAHHKKRKLSVVRPTAVRQNKTQPETGKKCAVCCKVIIQDEDPHYSIGCMDVNTIQIYDDTEKLLQNIPGDRARGVVKAMQRRYARLAAMTSQLCRIDQTNKKMEVFLVKPKICGAVCCAKCVPKQQPSTIDDFSKSRHWVFTHGTPKSIEALRYKCPACSKSAFLVPRNFEATVDE